MGEAPRISTPTKSKWPGWRSVIFVILFAVIIAMTVNYIYCNSKCKKCMCLSIKYAAEKDADDVEGLLLQHLRKWWPCSSEDDIELKRQPLGTEFEIQARIFCKSGENCMKPTPDCISNRGDEGVLRTIMGLIEGWSVDLIDFVGSGCIRDLTPQGGRGPIDCNYQDVVSASPYSCATPPDLHHPSNSEFYEGEAAVIGERGGLTLITTETDKLIRNREGAVLAECSEASDQQQCATNPKCEYVNNECKAADFNIVIPCKPGYRSTEANKGVMDTGGEVYYINAFCPEQQQGMDPSTYYVWGGAELGDAGDGRTESVGCRAPCEMPDAFDQASMESDSRIILDEESGPNSYNPNFAEFNVKYQCKPDYSPSRDVGSEPYTAERCERAGGEFIMNVDCVPDCTRPEDYEGYLVDGQSPPEQSPQLNFQSNFSNLICSSDYAATPGRQLSATRCNTGGGNYMLAGCNERCAHPQDETRNLYILPPERPSKDEFSQWTGGQRAEIQCAPEAQLFEGAHSESATYPGPSAHVCLDYGQQYGLTGCYPSCREDAECLNMKIEYPLGANIDRDTITQRIIDKLRENQNEGVGLPDGLNPITYYNEVPHSGGTIIEYQIECPYDDCEILKDPRFDDASGQWWYDSQQMAVREVAGCQGQVGEQREQCISAAMDAARNQYETLCDEGGVDRFDLRGLQVSNARTPRERHDYLIDQIQGLLENQPPSQEPCVCAPGFEPRTQQNIEDELRFSRDDGAANNLWPPPNDPGELGALTRWRQDAISRAQDDWMFNRESEVDECQDDYDGDELDCDDALERDWDEFGWLETPEDDILSAIRDGIEREWKVKCLPS